ncbi:hypothetical protein ABS71_17200 [bacterium SCN 62-11]|nr:type II secretion system F family protein [Candidatus Eremiobacteraeota bacterium]ODT60669.1 MAG: hypothetical protein ABS71_17200 [bacterium SCN 62-11]
MKWQRAQLFRSLSLLQSSGVRLDRALDLLGRQLPSGYPLLRAAAILRSGGGLAQALRDSDGLFSSYHQAVIQLGEKSGKLDDCFTYLAVHEESSQRLRQKIVAELTYPGLVFGCLLAMALVMGPLLLSWSPWILLLVPLLVACRVPAGRRLRASGPARRLAKVWATSHFLSCWGSLLQQGIALPMSLQLAAHASPEPECRAAVTRILEALRAGCDLPDCFRGCGYFSPLVVGTIAAGLECGSLDQLLKPLVDLYEVELETSLKAMTALLSPLCMLLIGGLLMLFLVTSVGPLLRLAAQL